MIPAGPGYLHTLIDQLAQRYAAGDRRDEAARAKEEFLQRAGKVFDDDGELFEARLAAFLEWYVIERSLDGPGVPPVLDALAEAGARPAEQVALAALATSRRSLFDVELVTPDLVELEDLLSGARFRVHERRSTAGFEVGQVVEARLLFDGGDVVFGKTFLFHPAEARELAIGHVDRAVAAGQSREDILALLARMHLRWHRAGHLSAARAYAAEA